MIAVDTNVIIHFLTGDDPRQSAAARVLFAEERVWIGKTVLLETAWVLGSLYGHDDGTVRDAFVRLLGLDNVQTESDGFVESAIALTRHGLDLPDALHLTSRPPGAFVTFDKRFVRRAMRAGANNISLLPAR